MEEVYKNLIDKINSTTQEEKDKEWEELKQYNELQDKGNYMEEEEYVTFEQAKALKEVGFPQNGSDYYMDEQMQRWAYGFEDNAETEITAIPTLSIVHKWLRKNKQIILEIYYSCTFGFWGYNRKVRGKYGYQGLDNHKFNTTGYHTYEEALSAGIDECIKLLK